MVPNQVRWIIAACVLVALGGALYWESRGRDDGSFQAVFFGEDGVIVMDETNALPDLRAYNQAGDDAFGQKSQRAFLLKSQISGLVFDHVPDTVPPLLEQADQVYSELRAEQPDNADLAYSHANLYLVVGMGYLGEEAWDKANTALVRAADIYSERRFDGPAGRMQLDQLSQMEALTSAACFGLGQLEKTVSHLEAALGYTEAVWSLNPHEQRSVGIMGIRLLALAEAVFYVTGDDARALNLIERGMSLHRGAYERDPNQIVNIVSASYMAMKGAGILLDADRLDEAETYINSTLGNFKNIVVQIPDNPELKAHLAWSNYLAGELARKRGKPDQALEFYITSEKQFDEALDAIVREEWLVNQTFVFGAIGDALVAQNEKEGALSYFQAGRDQLQPVLKPYAHRKWHALFRHMDEQVKSLN